MDVSETGDRLGSVMDAYEVLEWFTVRTLELGLYPHLAIGNHDLETDAFSKADLGLECQVSEL